MSDAKTQLTALYAAMAKDGVKLSYKDTSFWKFLNVMVIIFTLGKNRSFMYAITTVYKTIGVPVYWNLWPDQTKLEILTHELVHVRQGRKLTPPLFWLLYLLFPLPLGAAFFRYMFEREAYLAEFKMAMANGTDRKVLIDDVVESLSGPDYGWSWPKKWIRAWFEARMPK